MFVVCYLSQLKIFDTKGNQMKHYKDLEAVTLTDAEVNILKANLHQLTIMVQRSNQLLIKCQSTDPIFRGFLRKYPDATLIDARSNRIVVKVVVAAEQVELFKGWVLKTIRDVLLDDIGNAYAGDIKILPAQASDIGTPYIWRIRAGTTEHLIWRTDDHISDIRRACDAGQSGIKASVNQGFIIWNRMTKIDANKYQLNDIEVIHNTFTGVYHIRHKDREIATDNLIELFYHLYIFDLGFTEKREIDHTWTSHANNESFALAN